MIIIVESTQRMPMGYKDTILRMDDGCISTCNGIVVGEATSEEYVEHLTEVQRLRVPYLHGPYYYKVMVD